MSGQLRQVFWATRSVLYELPWQMCEGKTLTPLLALMPGVQGGIPLRIQMYLYYVSLLTQGQWKEKRIV